MCVIWTRFFFSRVVFSKFICCFWTPAIVWYSWQNTVFKKLCLFLCLKKACGDMLSIVLWRHVVHCVMDTYCPLCYGDIVHCVMETCCPLCYGDILSIVLWRHIAHCVMETYCPLCYGDMLSIVLWRHVVHCVMETYFPLCYGDMLSIVLWRHIVHCVMETYSSASSSESFFQLLELKWKETQFPECILFGILGDAQSPETKYLKLQPYTIDI